MSDPLQELTVSQRRACAAAIALSLSTAPTAELHRWAGEIFLSEVAVNVLGLSSDDLAAITPLLGPVPQTRYGEDATRSRSLPEPWLRLPPCPFLEQVSPDLGTRLSVFASLAVRFIASGGYDARVRSSFVRVARMWGIPTSALGAVEDAAVVLVAQQAKPGEAAASSPSNSSAPSLHEAGQTAATVSASKRADRYRWLKVGAASVAGAGLLLATGGMVAVPLLLPALGALGSAVGIGGVTSAAVCFFTSTTAGSALLLTLFGGAGGGLAAYKAAKKTSGLDVFRFVCLTHNVGSGRPAGGEDGDPAEVSTASSSLPAPTGGSSRNAPPPMKTPGTSLLSSLNPFRHLSASSSSSSSKQSAHPSVAVTADGLVSDASSSNEEVHGQQQRKLSSIEVPTHARTRSAFNLAEPLASLPAQGAAAGKHMNRADDDEYQADVTGIAELSVSSSEPSRSSHLHISASRSSLHSVALLPDALSGGSPGPAALAAAAAASIKGRGKSPGLHVFLFVSGTVADGAFKLGSGAPTTTAAGGGARGSPLPGTSSASERQGPSLFGPERPTPRAYVPASLLHGQRSSSPSPSVVSSRLDEFDATRQALSDLPPSLLKQAGPFILPWGGLANALWVGDTPGSVDSRYGTHTDTDRDRGARGSPMVCASNTDADRAVDLEVDAGCNDADSYDSDDDAFEEVAFVTHDRASPPCAFSTDIELQNIVAGAKGVSSVTHNTDEHAAFARSSASPAVDDSRSPGAPHATPRGIPKRGSVRVLADNGYAGGSGRGVRAGWFRSSVPYGEAYSVVYEPDVAARVSRYVSAFMLETLTNQAVTHVLAHTALGALLAAWQLPAMAVNALAFIDAPWSMAVTKADKAASALAEALLSGAHGRRPVSLVGWGLGARVIFKAVEIVEEEARRQASAAKQAEARSSSGHAPSPSPSVVTDPWDPSRAAGAAGPGHGTPRPWCSSTGTGPLPASSVIQDVVLFGAPCPTTPERWAAVRRVCSGRIVNGYCSTDFVLRFVYRSSSLHAAIAGLRPVTDGDTDGAGGHAADLQADAPVRALGPDSPEAGASAAACAWWRGVESIDVGAIVKGHLDYAPQMQNLLRFVGFEQ